ncbi:hypothetical protein EMIT0P395_190019 [Pseudomonas sp. IT-P395]
MPHHPGEWSCIQIPKPPRPPVGVSLLAIAVCQSMNSYLIHRYREQAHSYRVKFVSNAVNKR